MRQFIKYRLWFVFLFVLAGGTSCEKSILGGDPEMEAPKVFEFLSDDIENRYSYFELKNIDWEEVKERYRSLVYAGMDEMDLFDVLADMLFELEDGHVNLTSPFNRSRNWEWSQNYPRNYNQGIINQQYLGKDFWITGPLRHQIIDSVLYVNYRTFTEEVTNQAIDELIKRAQGLKGVIIDVRSNGGGNLGNALRIAGAFTPTSYKYGSVRIKNGSCADCFSSWTDLRVEPKSGLIFSGDVIVLTNRESYSSTTYFAQMMRENPNAILMGNSTGGGGGTPAFGELPNGWTYRFSSTQAINNEGEHLELGVPVDVEVDLEKSDENNDIDTILESALDRLR